MLVQCRWGAEITDYSRMQKFSIEWGIMQKILNRMENNAGNLK